MNMYKQILILIILTLSASGQVIEEQFRFGESGKEPGRFKNPKAIDIAMDGIVYVVDTGNHRIQLFNTEGRFIRSIGGFGFSEDQFDTPMDIWARSVINIYVSDYNNQRLQRYDRNMNYISTLERNEGDPPEFQFYEVSSAALNGQNELFIVDNDESKVIKFSRNGEPERTFGTLESGMGELELPVQIDVIPGNRLVVSDIGRRALMVYDFFGSFLTEITDEGFRTPRGIGVAADGMIFVADPGAESVFAISSDYKEISRMIIRGGVPLNQPQDVSFFKTSGGNTLIYIIDGEQVVVGVLIDKQE